MRQLNALSSQFAFSQSNRCHTDSQTLLPWFMFNKTFNELWGERFGLLTPNETIENILNYAGVNHNGKLHLVVYRAHA